MIRTIEAEQIADRMIPAYRAKLVHDGPFSPWLCEHEHPSLTEAVECARKEAIESGETAPFLVPERASVDVRELADGLPRPPRPKGPIATVVYRDGHGPTWTGVAPHVHARGGGHTDLRTHVQGELPDVRSVHGVHHEWPGLRHRHIEEGHGEYQTHDIDAPLETLRRDAPGLTSPPPNTGARASRLDAILTLAENWAKSETATPNETIRNDIARDLLPAARSELERLRSHHWAGHDCELCRDSVTNTAGFVNWQAGQIAHWKERTDKVEALLARIFGDVKKALGL